MSANLFRRLCLAVTVAGVLLSSAAPQNVELRESKPGLKIYDNSAKPGEMYSWKIYRKEKRELYLDLTPCLAEFKAKQIKAFTKPYRISKSPDIKCGNNTITDV